MTVVDVVAAVLVVVGVLNWGLGAVARFDLVAALFGLSFGEVSGLTAVVYGLVGVAGLYQALSCGSAYRAGGCIRRRTTRESGIARSTSQGVHMKTMCAFTSLALVGIMAVASPARAQHSKDIVDTAGAVGGFTTLAKALTAADLVATLKGPGPFTVFAPTDAAFAKLPAGTLDSLLKPENKDKLRRILTYHVVAGEVRTADVVKLQSAKSVSGDTITVKVRDGKVHVDDANVTKTDIEASNGVIHVIDTVILPKGI